MVKRNSIVYNKTNLMFRIFISVLLIMLLRQSADAQSCKLVDAINSKDKPLIEKLPADPSTDINCADSNNATPLRCALFNSNDDLTTEWNRRLYSGYLLTLFDCFVFLFLFNPFHKFCKYKYRLFTCVNHCSKRPGTFFCH